MAKAPSFQWYPKDCDTDENVRAMDDAEFGFYVRCLNHAWLNDGLPTDIAELARMMGKTPKQFLKLWVRVSRCFEKFQTLTDVRFKNSRMEQQRSEQETFRKSRVDAANFRHANKLPLHVHSKTDARAMHVECSASASASASATELLTGSSVDKTNTPSTAHPPVQSEPSKFSVPKKPMLPATNTSAGSVANELLSAARVHRMRTILHEFMRFRGGGNHPEAHPPPDDGTVLHCLTAIGTAEIEAVAAVLAEQWREAVQGKKPPKTYGWFVDRLRARYGGKTT